MNFSSARKPRLCSRVWVARPYHAARSTTWAQARKNGDTSYGFKRDEPILSKTVWTIKYTLQNSVVKAHHLKLSTLCLSYFLNPVQPEIYPNHFWTVPYWIFSVSIATLTYATCRYKTGASHVHVGVALQEHAEQGGRVWTPFCT